MSTILYIHGYNSNGNAWKCQQLRKMFPEDNVVAPTLDYDNDSPEKNLAELKKIVEKKSVDMIVGSSFGGYYTLCCTSFFDGPVWVINPVRDVVATLEILKPGIIAGKRWEDTHRGEKRNHTSLASVLTIILMDKIKQRRRTRMFDKMLEAYRTFDSEVFQKIHPLGSQLNMALSKDDQLLGSHKPLLEKFPEHNKVVWRDESGHTFTKFAEIRDEIAETL